MKAIVCYATGEIHLNSFGTDWTPCACGNVRVKWVDPNVGTVVVAARDRSSVRLLGLHNHYLKNVLRLDPSWEKFRELHGEATMAPGYLFDSSKVGCWAAVVRIGRSNDVRWATNEEFAEAFGEKLRE